MKTNKLTGKYTKQELVDSFVFRNELTPEQKKEADLQLKEARKQIKTEKTETQTTLARLLQLKFQIEDYLKNPSYDAKCTFGYFLKEYLASLSKKNKEFANDIDVSETELSQIINRHRPPNEKFIIRLEIHSNEMIPAIVWYRLLEKEKEHNFLTNKSIRKIERKHVKNILNLT